MYEIPLDPIPAQRFSVTLDNRECAFHLYWRGRRLYCDMDVAGKRVETGSICRDRLHLLQSPTGLFSGRLFFTDTRGKEDPRWDGLGTRWLLLCQPEGGA